MATIEVEKLASFSKIKRYKWRTHSSLPKLEWIHKTKLNVDHDYQRGESRERILAIARDWCWVALGALTVIRRMSGEMYVVDGQHRVGGAMRREDIECLPCVVFDIDDKSFEAEAFVRKNKSQRPTTSIETHRAGLVAGSTVAVTIQRVCDELGIEIGPNPHEHACCATKAVSSLEAVVERSGASALRDILTLCLRVTAGGVIRKDLVGGLHVIYKAGILDERLKQRLVEAGMESLRMAIIRRKELTGMGGENVCANAMLDVANKGLRKKYRLNANEDQ